MSSNPTKLLLAAYERALALTDYKVHDNLYKRHEFRKQTILADNTLSMNEKVKIIGALNEEYNREKVRDNEGIKRICEVCQGECLAILYCENCIRSYLKAKSLGWTSGNNDVDVLIQKCQMETFTPYMIIEWIPYNNLKNIKYLTKGGCSEIYTADWVDGHYNEWDTIGQQLRRYGTIRVALKKLVNVENAGRSWFEEVLILFKNILKF